MRVLALGGLAGPVLFAAITILCAALRPDYSHMHHFISELGATGTPHAWLMNYAGFLPAGLLLGGFGLSIWASVPRNAATALGALLVILFGAGLAASGLFSCDPGCPQAGGSFQNLIHDRLAPLLFISGSLGAVGLGIRFRSLPTLRSLWAYSIASGLLGLFLLGGVASTLESRAFTGLWQRLLVAVLFAWCAVVGLHLRCGDSPRPWNTRRTLPSTPAKSIGFGTESTRRRGSEALETSDSRTAFTCVTSVYGRRPTTRFGITRRSMV